MVLNARQSKPAARSVEGMGGTRGVLVAQGRACTGFAALHVGLRPPLMYTAACKRRGWQCADLEVGKTPRRLQLLTGIDSVQDCMCFCCNICAPKVTALLCPLNASYSHCLASFSMPWQLQPSSKRQQ